MQKVSTRRLVKPQVLQPATRGEVVSQKKISKPVCTPQNKQTQSEYSSILKQLDIICYRCQVQRHLAKDCPRKKTSSTSNLSHEVQGTEKPSISQLNVSDSFTRMDDSFTRMDKHINYLINLIKSGSNYVSSNTMPVLTHLSSVQKVEIFQVLTCRSRNKNATHLQCRLLGLIPKGKRIYTILHEHIQDRRHV